MFTSDQAFFDRIGPEETKRYFDECYKFICNYKNLGEKNIIPDIIRKGMETDEEEYTAFTNLGLTYSFGEKCWEIEKTNSYYNILIPENEDVVICGLNDVLETIKALIDLNPIIMLDGIASIDGGEKLNNYIQENNLRTL